MNDTPNTASDIDDDRVERTATTTDEIRERHEANRAAWNEGAVYYTGLLESDIERLRTGRTSLHPIERRALGDLRAWCGRAIHLQCASGMDTLSLWVEGAKDVVGIDISDDHIANARRMSDALEAPAQWFRCDVLDAPAELDGTADLVYTGRGAIGWLHDIAAWARVVARLLAPGGMLHLLEDHPFTWLLREEAGALALADYDYFDSAFSSKGWPASYIGDAAGPEAEQTRKYERLWTISAVVNALVGAGLHIERLDEHRERYWQAFPAVDPAVLDRLPMTWSLIARRR